MGKMYLFHVTPNIFLQALLVGLGWHSDVIYRYCNTSYAFPPQSEVVQFAVTTALKAVQKEPKTLVVCGAYTIGKEKIFAGTHDNHLACWVNCLPWHEGYRHSWASLKFFFIIISIACIVSEYKFFCTCSVKGLGEALQCVWTRKLFWYLYI